ncbi:hypothetical protein RJG79_01330 [Mycoplasmatota bacterium WC44]
MGYSKVKYFFAALLMITSFILYFFFYDFLLTIPIWVYNILWLMFVIDILSVLIPGLTKHSSNGKHFKKFFKEANYSKEQLFDYIKNMRSRVLLTFILYIFFLLGIGFFYYFKIINRDHIILLVIALNFIDYFCINTWCIFHKVFIRNRCCNTCRIYNWDHFFKFSPFIFIPEFRTLSLFILGIISLLQWEINYALHPERFTDISNENLKCTHCNHYCRFKNK